MRAQRPQAYAQSCTFMFILSGLGWVLGKTWALVRFVLAAFGSLPTSNSDSLAHVAHNNEHQLYVIY